MCGCYKFARSTIRVSNLFIVSLSLLSSLLCNVDLLFHRSTTSNNFINQLSSNSIYAWWLIVSNLNWFHVVSNIYKVTKVISFSLLNIHLWIWNYNSDIYISIFYYFYLHRIKYDIGTQTNPLRKLYGKVCSSIVNFKNNYLEILPTLPENLSSPPVLLGFVLLDL